VLTEHLRDTNASRDSPFANGQNEQQSTGINIRFVSQKQSHSVFTSITSSMFFFASVVSKITFS
jgi:hypothetical protein